MMKKLTFFLLTLLSQTLAASPVSRSEAFCQVQQFLRQRGLNDDIQIVDSPFKHHRKAEETATLYVFNRADNQGFVIASGDDRLPTVLGYADEGHIDPAMPLPEAMTGWMQDIEHQLSWLDENNIPSEASDLPQHDPVDPMLTCKWYQRDPYDLLLPDYTYKDTAGNDSIGKCNTGCGPTAMAMLMHYHQWPEALKATIPGYDNTTEEGGVEARLDDIPAQTPIRWADMQEVYGWPDSRDIDPEDARQAVAELLRMCAQGVRSVFSSSTFSYGQDMPQAFTDYFDYDDDLRRVLRTDYVTAKWDSLIYHELEARRPVLYEGSSLSGGHVFVVDGTDGTGLYHVNWGWTGLYNGYFLLSYLNPRDDRGHDAELSLSGYAFRQMATVGLQPATHNTIQHPTPNTHHPTLYNLQGQRLSAPPAHGLYIVNGRRVLK